MKKNVMMRIASFLMVAVLLSTCAISGTFAKYVTEATGSDTARVAKWGVTITANGDAFGTAYKSGDGTISATYNASTDSVHNNGSVDTKKIVAPGTEGTVNKMTISGAPEVDVTVTYDATVTLTGWDAYCPIIFTVGGDTYAITADSGITPDVVCANAAELATKVAAAIEAFTANYEANTDLSTASAPAISWEWPFSTNDANDVKDTALGNAATPATITIEITTIVTQVD